MAFEVPITILKVMEGIQSNRYVLAAIQREFVWDARQIEALFDSLMKRYPIGSFLFWKLDPSSLKDFQFYRFMDCYHQRDRTHNDPISLAGAHETIAVLDGQQRLTALTIGLKGWYADKLPYYHWSNDKAFPRRHLCLNLAAPAEEEEFEFRMLKQEDIKTDANGKFWFPVAEVLKFQELPDVMDYCHDHGLTSGESKYPYRTLMRLWELVHMDPVINYFLEEENDLEKVLNIFIRVNSGGTQLSYSDMLLSIAAAQWKDRDARQEINGLVDDLNKMGEGFSFTRDFVLKASLVLSDIRGIEFKVINFNRKNMKTIEEAWDPINHALHLTAKLLASWGYSRDTLVSNNAVIPLAYYLQKIGTPSGFVESTDPHTRQDRERMSRWLRIALLKRTFGGQSDNILRTSRTAIVSSSDGFPTEAIFDALRGTTKSMAFDEAELEGLLGYQYGQAYTFTVLAMLYPWLKYDQHFHVDHIFPRGLFTDKKLQARGIPRDRWPEWQSRVNDLANLQLLQGLPNQEKSDKDFEAWLETTQGAPTDIEAYRKLHLIPDVDLSFEAFPQFIRAREQVIFERIRGDLSA
jgi:hypothetical protein